MRSRHNHYYISHLRENHDLKKQASLSILFHKEANCLYCYVDRETQIFQSELDIAEELHQKNILSGQMQTRCKDTSVDKATFDTSPVEWNVCGIISARWGDPGGLTTGLIAQLMPSTGALFYQQHIEDFQAAVNPASRILIDQLP